MTQQDLELIKEYNANNTNEINKALDRMIAYCELCMKLNDDAENRR